MKAVVAAFNQEKALVGAFSVITNLRMELFEALLHTHTQFYSSTGGRMWARQHLGSGSGVKTEAALCVDIVAIYYLQVV